jgi:hypothetical protein
MAPFATIETRWFFDGDSSRHPVLKRWFETCAPVARAGNVPAPEWKGRADGEPDVYLLMPGCTDMGIKWREGTLQIKGRVEDLGPRRFTSRHEGSVQRWIKWTYEEVPAVYRSLFAAGEQPGPDTASVHKTRALRMISLDGGAPEEVAPGLVLERGIGFEMTDLERDGKQYCSIAFEAFPDDAATAAGFDAVIAASLEELSDTLGIGASMSYPEWLYR